jgi:hypothetical protein
MSRERLFLPNLCDLCASAVSPLKFFVPRLPVTPLFPLHTGHSPVTPLFPTHTKNVGGSPSRLAARRPVSAQFMRLSSRPERRTPHAARSGGIVATSLPISQPPHVLPTTHPSFRAKRGIPLRSLHLALPGSNERANLPRPKRERRITLPHLTSCANISGFTPAFLQKMSGRPQRPRACRKR